MAFAAVFRALSDPNRREILSMLKKGRMSAGEIGAQFDMSAATVSYHLAKLKEAELVYETRDKNYIYYSLNVSVFEDIMLWASQFLQGGNDDEKTD
ncbi:MAG: autorepressor SdpR family transcription factor [Oscillospiraceae bacterium]|nr:autorepressor SdpR family transcription factor [Oscillospiraceae bacterium]